MSDDCYPPGTRLINERGGYIEHDPVTDSWAYHAGQPHRNTAVGYNMMEEETFYKALTVAAAAAALITGGAVIIYSRRRDWIRLVISAVLFGGCIYGLFSTIAMRAARTN